MLVKKLCWQKPLGENFMVIFSPTYKNLFNNIQQIFHRHISSTYFTNITTAAFGESFSPTNWFFVSINCSSSSFTNISIAAKTVLAQSFEIKQKSVPSKILVWQPWLWWCRQKNKFLDPITGLIRWKMKNLEDWLNLNREIHNELIVMYT